MRKEPAGSPGGTANFDAPAGGGAGMGVTAVLDGDDYVINGRKWWSSGAGDTRCKVLIVMGKTDPTAAKHAQQSQIIVPGQDPAVFDQFPGVADGVVRIVGPRGAP